MPRRLELQIEPDRTSLGEPVRSFSGIERASSLISLSHFLSKARLLQGLSTSERDAVIAPASYRHLSATSVVMDQGEPADRLFLLVTGSARYFFITPDGRKVGLLWLVPGDIFGVACLLSAPAQFIVSTEVTRKSGVLVWQRDAIRTLARQYPRLLENALSIASDYLVWYLATHLSLICHSARERLAHVVVSLARGIGQNCPDGICLDVTNEQLANTANITPFTVSRLLSEWQRNGSILKHRGKIVLSHPERLLQNRSKFGLNVKLRRETP